MKDNLVITIGRQFGSGGKDVADALGRKLGFPVYDNELILKAAQDSGFSAEFFVQSDEKKRFLSLSAIFTSGWSGDAENYMRDRGNTLDVFLTSPLEVRAGRVAERQGIPVEEAQSLVERRDRSREEYYNYYTFGNWGMASNYDICMDSSMLGIEGTADAIIEFARKAGLI